MADLPVTSNASATIPFAHPPAGIGGGGQRVLLTGADGFTGRPLRKALEGLGLHVTGTVLKDPGPDDVVLDIVSADACASLVQTLKPDYVIHLAAISFVQHPVPTDFYRVNVVGTTNLLEALARLEKPPVKVILASSANIYGNIGGALIGESQPAAPANHYATSKIAMEMMAANYFDFLPILITRPFNYTGPGQSQSFLVPKIVSHFARGERAIELGNTDIERDFSDIDMVVDVYCRLLESPRRSVALNICTGVPTSLRALVEKMEVIAAYAIDVQVNPAFIRPTDIRQLTGDPHALVAAIGPLSIPPMETTLQKMYLEMRKTSTARV